MRVNSYCYPGKTCLILFLFSELFQNHAYTDQNQSKRYKPAPEIAMNHAQILEQKYDPDQ